MYVRCRRTYQLVICLVLSIATISSLTVYTPTIKVPPSEQETLIPSLATPILWTTSQVVSSESTQTSLRPDIAIDGSNNIHIVWEDSTSSFGSGDVDIVYSR